MKRLQHQNLIPDENDHIDLRERLKRWFLDFWNEFTSEEAVHFFIGFGCLLLMYVMLLSVYIIGGCPKAMAWQAKPTGAYTIGSTSWINNTNEICAQLLTPDSPWTPEAVTGMLGNVQGESGMNPWRWQNDKYDPSHAMGYGLFGYTPASKYIGNPVAEKLPGYGPNLSTSGITQGASARDGAAQLTYMDNGNVGWMSTAWRTYWEPTEYPELYQLRQRYLDQYGTNGRITFEEFKSVDDYEAATFFFLACFEGPAVPNYQVRLNLAEQIAPYVGASKKFPAWLLFAYQKGGIYNGPYSWRGL